MGPATHVNCRMIKNVAVRWSSCMLKTLVGFCQQIHCDSNVDVTYNRTSLQTNTLFVFIYGPISFYFTAFNFNLIIQHCFITVMLFFHGHLTWTLKAVGKHISDSVAETCKSISFSTITTCLANWFLCFRTTDFNTLNHRWANVHSTTTIKFYTTQYSENGMPLPPGLIGGSRLWFGLLICSAAAHSQCSWCVQPEINFDSNSGKFSGM